MQITMLKQQFEDTKQYAKEQHEQLAAKDRQIEELIKAAKKPRTVNNSNSTTNRYVVEQHVNVFGKETLSHISQEQIQRLFGRPRECSG